MRIHQHFQLRQLRLQTKLRGDGKLPGKLQLVGGIQLDFDLDRLDRRPTQAQRIDASPILRALYSLNLERAAQRVRVVLQSDHALQRRRHRIHGDDATFDQTGR